MKYPGTYLDYWVLHVVEGIYSDILYDKLSRSKNFEIILQAYAAYEIRREKTNSQSTTDSIHMYAALT